MQRPTHVTISTDVVERVLTSLAQQPLGAVLDVFMAFKAEVENSIQYQQREEAESADAKQ